MRSGQGTRTRADRGRRALRFGGPGLGPVLIGLAVACLASAMSLAAPTAAAAQEGEPPQEAAADTTDRRVREKLERLGRPLGADTLRPDTVELELGRRQEGGARRAPTQAGGDSIMQALGALPGYEIFRYEGEGAEFRARDGVLVLQGTEEAPARVLLATGDVLTADSAIVYDEGRGRVSTRGEAVFTPVDGDPVHARRIVFDLETERGTATGARTQYAERGVWYVQGDLPYVAEDLSYGHDATFTSCELEVPHYHFATDEIKIHAGRILVARPVRLYFADVPVGWLPFMAQSLARGRRSGLLTPRFSLNDVVRTSQGHRRRLSNVGFYWAMSDYSDATVALDWFSDEFVAVTSSIRYNWVRQFLDGQLNFRRFWRESGATELAFDTRHNWEISERTQFRMSARYASSTRFVRQSSFDPREVTQSINSQGGLNHRFDWGNLTVNANRRQFLSDDRVEMTLPNASLSLNPFTFFEAPPSRASWYNNLTWTGSGRYSRDLTDRAAVPDTSAFSFGLADRVGTQANLNSSFNLGRLSWSQNVNFRETRHGEVPDTFLVELEPGVPHPIGLTDLSQAEVDWSMSLGYQQSLVGSTTLTPNLSVSGSARRSDTIPAAQSFVTGPSRLSVGASLRSDVYGFYPGFGPFQAIRHKVQPSVSWSYAPEIQSDALQQRVFGATTSRVQNVLRVGFSQTWEAKLEPRADDVDDEEGRESPGERAQAEVPAEERVTEEEAAEEEEVAEEEVEEAAVAEEEVTEEAEAAVGEQEADTARAAEREEEPPVVTLLGLRTNALTYDFEEADETGDVLRGFRTTSLSNQISSDYLRGLTISMVHDLFDDSEIVQGEEGEVGERRFAPHLSQLNLSFNLNSESGIVRFLGSLYGDEQEDEPVEPAADPEDEPFPREEGTDETVIVPGPGEPEAGRGRGPSTRTGQGGWRASVSYSLNRPRAETAETRQMVMGNLTFRPTENWDVSWRTSYDLEAGQFNDHIVRLSRDLHRWEANFDFQQTATGNWTFRFEVQLRDNRDLKFDYEQRELEGRRFR